MWNIVILVQRVLLLTLIDVLLAEVVIWRSEQIKKGAGQDVELLDYKREDSRKPCNFNDTDTESGAQHNYEGRFYIPI